MNMLALSIGVALVLTTGVSQGWARCHPPCLETGLKPGHVKDIQQGLSERGYRPGKIDGKFGRQTRDAVQDFQKAEGLKPTGKIDKPTLDKLGRSR
jgi:peptidoglycan hydrolase-like protein with peptidoglycan-binding domain